MSASVLSIAGRGFSRRGCNHTFTKPPKIKNLDEKGPGSIWHFIHYFTSSSLTRLNITSAVAIR
jgi:hypothetical protein